MQRKRAKTYINNAIRAKFIIFYITQNYEVNLKVRFPIGLFT